VTACRHGQLNGLENATDRTWCILRHELDRMHMVPLVTGDGQVAQRSTLTPEQKTILTALNLPEPPRFLHSTATATAS
jgi:hypothetical protein